MRRNSKMALAVCWILGVVLVVSCSQPEPKHEQKPTAVPVAPTQPKQNLTRESVPAVTGQPKQNFTPEAEQVIQYKTILAGSQPAKGYVFLEHLLTVHGECTSGKYRGPRLNASDYLLHEESGVLEGIIDFELNQNVKIIYGARQILTGDAGSGEVSTLGGVSWLPYDNGYDIKVSALEAGDVIHLEYKQISLTLQPGQCWRKVTTKTDNQAQGRATLTIEDKLIHHGRLDKAKIVKWADREE